MNGGLLLAVAVSATALGLLAWRDPKRLRALVTDGRGMQPPGPLTVRARQWLGVAAAGPGVVLALAGAWIAFLVWLGATCLAGWAMAQALGSRMASPRP